jgi:hypothetical protein
VLYPSELQPRLIPFSLPIEPFVQAEIGDDPYLIPDLLKTRHF